MFGLLIAFAVEAGLDALVSFSRGFPRVASVLCYGFHVVSTRCSGKPLLAHVA